MNSIEKELKIHITNMLENILTQAELKTLARNKGITASGLNKDGLVGLVAEKFLSTDRISEIYKDLSPGYHFLLHYLKANKGPIELKRAFRYLENWDIAKSRKYFPYVAKKDFRRLFTQFKTDLAVKGLILIIESKDLYFDSTGSKFERFSLSLPEKFFPFIPPLQVQGEKRDQKGVTRSFETFAKNLLLSSLGLRNPMSTIEKEMTGSFPCQKGAPYFKDRQIFRPDDYTKHIYSIWCRRNFYDHYPDKMDIASNIFYIFEVLQEGEWINLSTLQESFRRLTRIYDLKTIGRILSKVCEEAADIGLLEKIDASRDPSYRLHTGGLSLIKGSGGKALSVNGISIEKNGSLQADLEQVSLFALFDLLLISDWALSGQCLLFSPSPIKLGKFFRVFSDFSKLGIYAHLIRNSISYKQAFKKVEGSFGKYMIHSNLSIFEITDITISALLTHTFPEIFFPIGGDFFAVSERDENKIMKFLEQRKYSIKIKDQGAL